MNIVRWPINPELKKETDEHYRTKFALSLKNREPLDIVRDITFDGVAPDITIADVERFVQFVNDKLLDGKLKGTGLEVGAGCGFFSSLFAKQSKVDRVYAVEVCENIVTELMPKIVEYVAGQKQDKVVGCIGEFDRIELQNSSIDFVFDFYSLHHSNNLDITLKEIFRVLRPGGFIFCFDKTRANSLTLDDLDDLLEKEYSAEAKKSMGIPENQFHNRRMNGEKEYRLKDWQQSFSRAGFHSFSHYHIARTNSARPIVRTIKKIISKFPIRVQTLLTRFIRGEGNKNNLEESHKIYTSLIEHFPKEISFMIAWK